ncbi:(2Fe-2S)-binding protein [Paramagnetospirillum marisnigri]|uniref:(2Fe-2S)-binding protein n=1 Tax=Paramagnetospirillum marisnigri TaxID=1285242 RepID=A0A178N0A6_9PROT|nr:(2Fe-2S)-binding protein [Paramagnetospirillum marisnigri]OAN56010.1 (2Fe-2S)-binding protein [Paramagnetospirillum marisnigri]
MTATAPKQGKAPPKTPDIRLSVNGKPRTLSAASSKRPLLHALRDELGLTATKYGCGKGQCGACTVLADGQPVRACLMTVAEAAGKSITTLEGLGTPKAPHAVQAAFIAEQASQCGYCTSGMVMETAALLATTPEPSLEDAKQALSGHLCRCGSHRRILRAVMRASGRPQP